MSHNNHQDANCPKAVETADLIFHIPWKYRKTIKRCDLLNYQEEEISDPMDIRFPLNTNITA